MFVDNFVTNYYNRLRKIKELNKDIKNGYFMVNRQSTTESGGRRQMEAIIFDVDGTLWDSTEEVAVSWNRAIREQTDLNRVLTGSELKKEFGKPLEEIADDLFPTLSRKEKEELAVHLYQYENEWVESAPCILYDKMPETIRALSKRYRLINFSNSQSG